jgi:hypothetical protein
MTSSTPERRLDVRAGGVEVNAGETAEVQGHGDLVVRTTGHPAHVELELHLGDRSVSLVTSEAGVAVWRGPGVLGQVAGELRIRVDDDVVTLRVRPGKLTEARMRALLADLEAFGEGLSQEAGGRTASDGLRSRDDDLTRLDAAVGRAAEAAPAIRRRPLHRARDVVRAAPRDRGASTAADVRWLATHPAHALRAEAQGREVGVVRERSADLDTAENRGVLSAYDQIAAAVDRLRDVVDAELAVLERRRPSREAFLTEAGNLYDELDRPRVEALTRRRERLDALRREALALRPRSGLPDLRPRGAVMVRTPRVDAEPAYWATWRAFEEARTTRPPPVPARPAPVKSLDALWEQWCAVAVVRAVRAALGPPDRQQLVDSGWFATLRRGPIATWTSPGARRHRPLRARGRRHRRPAQAAPGPPVAPRPAARRRLDRRHPRRPRPRRQAADRPRRRAVGRPAGGVAQVRRQHRRRRRLAARALGVGPVRQLAPHRRRRAR